MTKIASLSICLSLSAIALGCADDLIRPSHAITPIAPLKIDISSVPDDIGDCPPPDVMRGYRGLGGVEDNIIWGYYMRPCLPD